MKLDSTLKWLIPALIVIGLFLWMFFPWQCSQAQTTGTAGSFSLSFDYSTGVDRAMQKQLGPEWIAVVKDRLREAWRNHKNSAQEAYKAGLTELFDESLDPDLLLKTESNQLMKIADSVKIRKERKAALIKAAEVQAVEPNIGKAYSPRMLFVGSFETEGGGGGGKPRPPFLGHGYIDGEGLVVVAVVLVVAAAVLIVAVYGLYQGGKWLVKRW